MAKMIKCKACGAEIASSAKVCPGCGAKNQKPIYKKAWFWAIVVIVIIGAGSTGGNNSGDAIETIAPPESQNTASVPDAGQKEEIITYSVGELITAKDFEITVESVGTTNEVGTSYFNSTPSEGGIYVTVDISYKNISDEPKGMLSTPSFSLIDPKGVKYSSDISASSYYATEKDPDRKILSDLNPGIKVNDNNVFEVAEELYANGEGWQILIRAGKDYYVAINE